MKNKPALSFWQIWNMSFGFLGIQFGWGLQMSDKYALLASMACIGIAWASILSMPYAMLTRALPKDKVGVMMGMFNLFIVIPQETK